MRQIQFLPDSEGSWSCSSEIWCGVWCVKVPSCSSASMKFWSVSTIGLEYWCGEVKIADNELISSAQVTLWWGNSRLHIKHLGGLHFSRARQNGRLLPEATATIRNDPRLFKNARYLLE